MSYIVNTRTLLVEAVVRVGVAVTPGPGRVHLSRVQALALGCQLPAGF